MRTEREQLKEDLKECLSSSFDDIFHALEKEMNKRLSITLFTNLDIIVDDGVGGDPFKTTTLSNVIDDSIKGFEEWIPGIISGLEKEVQRLRKIMANKS